MDQVKANSRQPRRPRRGGYILVMTLGLLVLATTLLVAVGRASVHRALEARLAAEALRRHWGLVSCRVAVLPFAEQILVSAERQRGAAAPVVRANVHLGSETYQLIISDESAKANVNAMLDESDDSTVESRIRAALSGTGMINAIRLRPASLSARPSVPQPASRPSTTQPAEPSPPEIRQWISGLGQVFNEVPPQRLVGSGGASPVDRLTCWGNGTINLMRASEASLQLGASPPLTRLQIDRLIDARNGVFQLHQGAKPSLLSPAGTAPNTANLDPVTRLLAQAQVQVKDRAAAVDASVNVPFPLDRGG